MRGCWAVLVRGITVLIDGSGVSGIGLTRGCLEEAVIELRSSTT